MDLDLSPWRRHEQRAGALPRPRLIRLACARFPEHRQALAVLAAVRDGLLSPYELAAVDRDALLEGLGWARAAGWHDRVDDLFDVDLDDDPLDDGEDPVEALRRAAVQQAGP